jgi:hypothetical protein
MFSFSPAKRTGLYPEIGSKLHAARSFCSENTLSERERTRIHKQLRIVNMSENLFKEGLIRFIGMGKDSAIGGIK